MLIQIHIDDMSMFSFFPIWNLLRITCDTYCITTADFLHNMSLLWRRLPREHRLRSGVQTVRDTHGDSCCW